MDLKSYANRLQIKIIAECESLNISFVFENPVVPKTVSVAPYWGPIARVPNDRRLREEHGLSLPLDTDVSDIWWPEFKNWLDTEFLRSDAAVSGIA
jgi:hypothetical protein